MSAPKSRLPLRAGARFRLEQLECRTVPAGNVFAALQGGDLVLHGDQGDNAVKVSVTGGNLEVRGLEGTTVNNSNAVVFQGVTAVDDLRAFLLHGDNRLEIDRLTVNDGLQVLSSSGDTAVLVERTTVGDDARIHTGFGDDRVAIVDSTVGGNLSVSTGFGDDGVFLDPTAVTGRTTIDTGFGDDSVRLHGANAFAGLVTLDGGFGQDVLEIDEDTQLGAGRRVRQFESVQEVAVIVFSVAERDENGNPLRVRNIPAGDPEGTGSTDFTVDGAHFSGGEVSFAAFGPAYATAPASYRIDATGGNVGRIEFEEAVTSVSFFFVGLGGAPVARAYDAAGELVAEASAGSPTFLGDPGNFVRLASPSGIARIEITGGVAVIDNVAFPT